MSVPSDLLEEYLSYCLRMLALQMLASKRVQDRPERLLCVLPILSWILPLTFMLWNLLTSSCRPSKMLQAPSPLQADHRSARPCLQPLPHSSC